MEQLGLDTVVEILQKSGISDEKIKKVVGTLRISLARQAAKNPEKSIILSKSTISELEDSLRIGAGITPSEAKNILVSVQSTLKAIKAPNDPKIKFLDEGIFEIDENDLKFKIGK